MFQIETDLTGQKVREEKLQTEKRSKSYTEVMNKNEVVKKSEDGPV